jgi:hypothetical protein
MRVGTILTVPEPKAIRGPTRSNRSILAGEIHCGFPSRDVHRRDLLMTA